uniref:Reactive intermediate imine deaminase A homolog n=1 Tax=Oncorhynchus tshawytscha TaxID=74940 RepID=A0AAZ3RW05_ONCTS
MAAVQKLFPYTPKAPIRQGIYSQAVVVDRTMYISGQLGLDVASGKLVEGGVQAQARQALVNMGEILKAAGCGYDNVVKTTVLLADINDFVNVNDVYKTFRFPIVPCPKDSQWDPSSMGIITMHSGTEPWCVSHHDTQWN